MSRNVEKTRPSSRSGATDAASVSLAAAGTAAHGAGVAVPSTAKNVGADASLAGKRPHFLDVPGQAGHSNQLQSINLLKSYRKGAVEVPVLRGTLDAPDRGEIHYAGQRIDNLPARARDHLRNCRFGMIFQFYHLLPELTTLENVLSPLMIAHGVLSYFRHRSEHRARAEQLLEMVGLSHRLKHRPRELSGGEMQRAAIARALVAQPDLLLADEPTGNLDQATGQEIIQILRTLNRQQNLTIVMVTHNRAIADQADRIVRLVNGRIEE